MKFNIGTENQLKVTAVKDVIQSYDAYKDAEFIGVAVDIPEFGHPRTLEETMVGAIERAKQARGDGDYGVGIEGGLVEAPGTITGYFEIGACVIYDGATIASGLSPGFEWPAKVLELILNGRDGSQALREAGITTEAKVGTTTGGISLLTEGRMDRAEQTRHSVTMAMIHLQNPGYFK